MNCNHIVGVTTGTYDECFTFLYENSLHGGKEYISEAVFNFCPECGTNISHITDKHREVLNEL